MSYRIVIPTAGTGSRLGQRTRYINKSLISVANRPVISHIIDQFPHDSEFVIALGYKGSLVREFLKLAYPERSFYFAEVKPYEGQGSGLGYSLMCCKHYLQQPFVFVSCDTLVRQHILPPDHNWIGCAEGEDLSSYRTVRHYNQDVQEIYEKGKAGAGHDISAYIGLAGIKDYVEFWEAMQLGGSVAIDQGEAYGLSALLEKGSLKAHQFTWFDTGTPYTLEQAKSSYKLQSEPNILDKENEAIWFVSNNVIKFSADQEFISNRVLRSSKLEGYIPNVTASSDHMYCYPKVEGRVLSEVVTLPIFRSFLEHCREFWSQKTLSPQLQADFYSKCKYFYFDKTKARIELFYKNFNKRDGTEYINDEEMPPLSSLLERVDWALLSQGLPGRFHGDFHFENILWNPQNETFTFLDWRQDFGGDLDVGDIYYDLAKLLHGLIISHELIAANDFFVDWSDHEIRFDFHRKQVLVECELFFSMWCNLNGYDYVRVKLITAIIFLNISALHHYPYSLLLYALGKRMLKLELVS